MLRINWKRCFQAIAVFLILVFAQAWLAAYQLSTLNTMQQLEHIKNIRRLAQERTEHRWIAEKSEQTQADQSTFPIGMNTTEGDHDEGSQAGRSTH